VEQISTKDRILDAAEQLFADRGFANTSLRQITAAAGANIAAVNYYFQSKEALIRAVFSRRLVPINKRRLELLDQLEARGKPLSVEEVLRAFIEPVLCSPQGLQGFMTFGRLVGRMYSDPSDMLSRVFLEELAEVRVRFVAAIQRAMPELPLEELYWKLHFAIAVFAQTLTGLQRLKAISGGVCDISDSRVVLERMVAFVAAGFRAPSAVGNAKGEPQCKGN